MYTAIVVVQALTVAAGIMVFAELLMKTKPVFAGKFLYVAFACAVFDSIGYLMEITSVSRGGAITAVKIEYVGICFGMLMLLIYIFQVCKVKSIMWFYLLLFILNVATVGIVMTCEFHDFYYTSIEFETDWLYPHLVLGKGPWYGMHFMIMAIMVFSIIIVAARRYIISAKTEVKESSFLSVIIFVGVMVIFLIIAYLMGLLGYFDPTSMLFLWVCIFIRYNILDITPSAVETVSDVIQESLIVVDKNYIYVDSNREARNVFPEFEAKKFERMKIGEYSSLLEDIFTCDSEREFKIGDRYYRSNVVPIYGNNKNITGYTACIIDITDSYLNVKQLVSMKNKADIANKAKSEFLANVSHEIRTPLNAIIGMTELALREDASPAVREKLFDIKSAGSSLLAIINDILDFAKLESNKVEVVNSQYNVAALISDVVSIINVKIEEKNIFFEQNVNPDIPALLSGDEMKVRQILINLLGNAVKYTEKGKITFTMDFRRDGDYAIIEASVEDTGVGISKENISKLFSSFQRVDSRKNRSIEGTGLGLAISKQYLSLMGGDISVKSTYGVGSKFTFTLPQKIVNDQPCDYHPFVHLREKQEQFRNSFIAPSAKVLVVDDNPVNIKIAAGYLKSYKIEADSALGGLECVEKVSKTRYDIVLLDYMMPEVDGVDTLKLIRAKSGEDEYYKKLPIVALTADAVNGSEEKFKNFGFNEYLAKPINEGKLEDVLAKFLPPEIVAINVEIDDEEIEKADVDFEIEGVNTEIGLDNCGNEFEDYIEILGIFYRFGLDKIGKISYLYEEKNFKDYIIEVHSLKSSAANIGALEVSALARELEMAGKAENYEFIDDHAYSLIEMYSELLENIGNALKNRQE